MDVGDDNTGGEEGEEGEDGEEGEEGEGKGESGGEGEGEDGSILFCCLVFFVVWFFFGLNILG